MLSREISEPDFNFQKMSFCYIIMCKGKREINGQFDYD